MPLIRGIARHRQRRTGSQSPARMAHIRMLMPLIRRIASSTAPYWRPVAGPRIARIGTLMPPIRGIARHRQPTPLRPYRLSRNLAARGDTLVSSQRRNPAGVPVARWPGGSVRGWLYGAGSGQARQKTPDKWRGKPSAPG
jgi:hypothetical protein